MLAVGAAVNAAACSDDGQSEAGVGGTTSSTGGTAGKTSTNTAGTSTGGASTGGSNTGGTSTLAGGTSGAGGSTGGLVAGGGGSGGSGNALGGAASGGTATSGGGGAPGGAGGGGLPSGGGGSPSAGMGGSLGGGGAAGGSSAGAGSGGGSGGGSSSEGDFDPKPEDFECISNWEKVSGFRITNALGKTAEAVAVAKSASGGVYPVGTIIQHLPTEAMVKRRAGFSAETKDWEFFILQLSADGQTTISERGTTELRTMGQTCASCHMKAPDDYDFICNIWGDQGSSNCGFNLNDNTLDSALAMDTRCE